MAMNEDVRENEIEEDGSSIIEIEEENSSDDIEVLLKIKKPEQMFVKILKILSLQAEMMN